MIYYPGMLSKSKGQILRVAAVLHALFQIENPEDIPTVILVEALIAADNFVSVCLQHVAYIAGRGSIEEAIKQAKTCKYKFYITGHVSFYYITSEFTLVNSYKTGLR